MTVAEDRQFRDEKIIDELVAAGRLAQQHYEENGSQEVFDKAMSEAKPSMEVRPKRIGGSVYQIPMEVRPARRSALAMRWIATYARSRSEKNMTLRLANELLEACEGRGEAVKKKEDTHRMAEANRAFSHFRF